MAGQFWPIAANTSLLDIALDYLVGGFEQFTHRLYQLSKKATCRQSPKFSAAWTSGVASMSITPLSASLRPLALRVFVGLRRIGFRLVDEPVSRPEGSTPGPAARPALVCDEL